MTTTVITDVCHISHNAAGNVIKNMPTKKVHLSKG